MRHIFLLLSRSIGPVVSFSYSVFLLDGLLKHSHFLPGAHGAFFLPLHLGRSLFAHRLVCELGKARVWMINGNKTIERRNIRVNKRSYVR